MLVDSGALALLFALAISHALCDFPLQGRFIAIAKNRHADLSEFFGDSPPKHLWVHALSAHSLIHAGGVWLVSGSLTLGFLEFVLHWLIDFGKNEDLTSFHTDQLLHYLCKFIYVALLIWAPSIVF